MFRRNPFREIDKQTAAPQSELAKAYRQADMQRGPAPPPTAVTHQARGDALWIANAILALALWVPLGDTLAQGAFTRGDWATLVVALLGEATIAWAMYKDRWVMRGFYVLFGLAVAITCWHVFS